MIIEWMDPRCQNNLRSERLRVLVFYSIERRRRLVFPALRPRKSATDGQTWQPMQPLRPTAGSTQEAERGMPPQVAGSMISWLSHRLHRFLPTSLPSAPIREIRG